MEPEEFAKRLVPGNQDAPVLEAVRAGKLDTRSRPSIPIEIGRLTIRVAPDVVSVYGMRVPVTPWAAQKIAEDQQAILPSRKLVDEIWKAAAKRIEPVTRENSGETNTALGWLEHSRAIDSKIGDETGLVSGQKKDIVVGPSLDGKKVAIYGWHRQSGQPIQPYSTVHGAEFIDYSHGARLISRSATLDGEPVDLREVFRNPTTVDLVSDQGMFDPVFPNVGSVAPPASCRDGNCALPSPPPTPPAERSRVFEIGVGIAGVLVGIWGIMEARKRRAR